jgi:hypothetical protein
MEGADEAGEGGGGSAKGGPSSYIPCISHLVTSCLYPIHDAFMFVSMPGW